MTVPVRDVSTASPQQPVVVVAEAIDEAGLDLLSAHTQMLVVGDATATGLVKHLENADALIVRSSTVTGAMMSAAPRLRVIGRHGAGVDNIDLDAARRLGIGVVNTPASNSEAVAEFSVLTAAMLLRAVAPATAALRSGSFDSLTSLPGQVVRHGLIGRELSGATMGVVGLGAIGRSVAQRAQSMGMRVIGFDPALTPERIAAQRLEFADSLLELASQVDVLSLHVPLTAATRRLVDRDVLSALPRGSHVVNTARAEVIDEVALLEALLSGHVASAALDVFAPEPPSADHPLLALDQVIATPHMAAMTVEALQSMATTVSKGVLDVLSGKTATHVVVPPRR